MIRKQKNSRSKLDGVGLSIVMAIAFGIILIMTSAYFEPHTHGQHVVLEIVKELGVVLTSVFGVSLFYEKFLAERHFVTFYTNLKSLIGQGQTNAATCEALGILQIFKNRRELEDNNTFSVVLNRLSEDDYYRVIGRSLIFTIYGWNNFKMMLTNGAKLELCMIKPDLNETWLPFIAGYSPLETAFVVQRIRESIVPWLETAKPKGSFYIRFHDFPLLDSLSEVRDGGESRIVWDINFGEGLEARHVFYLDGNGVLGKNIKKNRYNIIWDRSEEVFSYKDGAILSNTILS